MPPSKGLWKGDRVSLTEGSVLRVREAGVVLGKVGWDRTGHTCCKARSRAIHRALEPLTRPWEYCRPSRTMAGWITEDGMLVGWRCHTLCKGAGALTAHLPLVKRNFLH